MLSAEFSTTVLSAVRFSTVIPSPVNATPIVIRARVWAPEVHHCYPESFRKATKEILLCSMAHRSHNDASTDKINLAASLPKALWMEIFSYTNRSWFEQPHTEETLLRQRLRQLEASLQHVQQSRQELENQLRVAERERELYRQTARALQSRLARTLGGQLGGDVGDGAIVVMGAEESDSDDNEEDSEDEEETRTLEDGEADNVDDEDSVEIGIDFEDTDDMEEDSSFEAMDESISQNMGKAMDNVPVSHAQHGRTVRAVSLSSDDV